jgi:hypothetical protein
MTDFKIFRVSRLGTRSKRARTRSDQLLPRWYREDPLSGVIQVASSGRHGRSWVGVETRPRREVMRDHPGNAIGGATPVDPS